MTNFSDSRDPTPVTEVRASILHLTNRESSSDRRATPNMSSSHAILSCQAARRAAANPSRAGKRLENSLFSYKSIWQDLKDRREIAPFFRSAALSAFEKTAFERNVEPVDVGTHSEDGLRKSTQRKSIFGGNQSRSVGKSADSIQGIHKARGPAAPGALSHPCTSSPLRVCSHWRDSARPIGPMLREELRLRREIDCCVVETNACAAPNRQSKCRQRSRRSEAPLLRSASSCSLRSR